MSLTARVLGLTVALLVGCGGLSRSQDSPDLPVDWSTGTCGRTWGEAEVIGHIPGDMKEVSGLVSSPAHPGVAWMIRDSGNPTILYSFEFDGGTPRYRKFPVAGTENGDWEDIAYTTAADGRGRLWILDNRSKRTSPKRIYEVAEPDPGREKRAELLGTYRWEYPDNGGNYDTETFFALEGVLHVITKAETNGVYRFDAPLSPTGLNHRPTWARCCAGHPLRVRFDHGRRAALRRLLHQAGHRLGLRGGRRAGSGSHRRADLQPGDGVFRSARRATSSRPEGRPGAGRARTGRVWRLPNRALPLWLGRRVRC